MKKEISEHLAKAFFEKKSVKRKDENSNLFIWLACSIVVIVILSLIAFSTGALKRIPILRETLSVEQQEGPYKIKFDFSNSSVPVAALNIEVPSAELSKYIELRFRVRLTKSDSLTLGSLKVELVNSRQETACIYISDIGTRWKTISIPFKDFKVSSNWLHLNKLSFTLERWNIKPLKGELLIDSVEFVK